MSEPAATAVPPAAPPRGRAFWLWQLLPPLLLFATMLGDEGSGFVFGLGALALVVLFCVVSLFVKAVKLLFRRGDPARMLRPLLCIAIVVGAFFYAFASRDEARRLAGTEARRLQAECVANRRCPDAIAFGDAAGDAADGNRRRIPTPPTHLRWTVRYQTDPETDTFELALPENMDVMMVWRGGVATPLTLEIRGDLEEMRPLESDGAGPAPPPPPQR